MMLIVCRPNRITLYDFTDKAHSHINHPLLPLGETYHPSVFIFSFVYMMNNPEWETINPCITNFLLNFFFLFKQDTITSELCQAEEAEKRRAKRNYRQKES